ncbi:RNA exonuclease 5-like [Neovison vison]|uniref:RNA exonuclease 5-like n=1 Tax=Neovison vison TaxID=452646 RepID=UPI001CF07E0E|nr:RNA exonuclease 5-like [Neogale vison]
MDPERERSGGHPKKGRKRRRAPNMLVGAAEAMRDRRDLEERQPEAKVSNDYPRWAARGGEEGQGLPPAAFRALPALEAEG